VSSPQPEPPQRRLPAMPPVVSLARTLHEYGERWEIERVDRNSEWIAVYRETGGGYIQVVSARDLDALRYRMDQVECAEPEERETGRTRHH